MQHHANPVGVDGGDGSEGYLQQLLKILKPEEGQTFENWYKWDLLNEQFKLTAAISVPKNQNTRIQLDQIHQPMSVKVKVDGIELGLNGKITDKWAVSCWLYLFRQ